MRRRILVSMLALSLSACGDDRSTKSVVPPASSPASSSAPTPGKQPDHIVVDHILIGVASARFAGKRSEADARGFAKDLLAKLKDGSTDWDAAKRQYSEDPPPGGPYGMSNFRVAPVGDEMPRDGMVPAFGDVGFSLAVGEIGLAEFDLRTSPFGFHIIKRVK